MWVREIERKFEALKKQLAPHEAALKVSEELKIPVKYIHPLIEGKKIEIPKKLPKTTMSSREVLEELLEYAKKEGRIPEKQRLRARTHFGSMSTAWEYLERVYGLSREDYLRRICKRSGCKSTTDFINEILGSDITKKALKGDFKSFEKEFKKKFPGHDAKRVFDIIQEMLLNVEDEIDQKCPSKHDNVR